MADHGIVLPLTDLTVNDAFLPYRLDDIQQLLIRTVQVSPRKIRRRVAALDVIVNLNIREQAAILEECAALPPAKCRKVLGQDTIPATAVLLHDGQRALDVFGHLTVAKLCEIARTVMTLTSKDSRSKARLFEAIARAPQNLQKLLIKAGMQTHPQAPVQDTSAPHTYQWQETSFLRAPTDAILKARTADFIRETSNAALAQVACSVCAREVYARESQAMRVSAIPNLELLSPVTPHPAQATSHVNDQSILLYPTSFSPQDTVHLCDSCHRLLCNHTRPKHSLANDMWVGDVPQQLRGLHLPEKLLIGLYLPAAHVIKLYPKKAGALFWNPASLYDGLRGNVSTFPLDQRQIADMLDIVKPAPLAILSATIAITFITPKGLPSNFSVRRTRVAEALAWLKANNPLYSNIDISPERIAALPENAVPEELYQITRVSDDFEGHEREQESYIPHDGESNDIQGNPTHVDPEEEGDSDRPSPPGVIPITPLGVIDCNGANIPERDLMAHALANATREKPLKGDYAIRHGTAFDPSTGARFDGGTDNPSHLLGAFPYLFPFGRGGFELQRSTDWTMQYADKRFRMDSQFMFQIFGVIQKRQVCRAATLQISGAGAQRHRHLLQLQEETARQAHENPAALRRRVEGTDESRFVVRSYVWGTNLLFNPPTLWMTINPSDVHCPIAQVFTGTEIDLDASHNITSDPYAAAKYFNFIIRTLFETLMGIAVTSKGTAPSREEAYVATVEAQGRGTLHLHALLKAILQSDTFRAPTIHADIQGKSDHEVKSMKPVKEIGYSRPTEVVEKEAFHECSPTSCKKKIRGASEAWVKDTGENGPRRVAGFLNSWNPAIIDNLRCNHDLKLLLATSLLARIKQQRSSNTTAILAKQGRRPDSHNRNKRLLERCANALTKERDYLMGFGDRYTSHTYAPIYWERADAALKQQFPSLDPDHVRDDVDDGRDDSVTVTVTANAVELHDQLKDYQYRGDALESYSFFDFCIGTYEEIRKESQEGGQTEASDELEQEPATIRGRRPNIRVAYQEGAGKPKKCRVIRTKGHETLPRFSSKWIPPSNEPTLYPLYCASVLLLLWPWRSLQDLKGAHASFSEAYDSFMSACTPRDRRVVENLQFYHTCAQDAKADAASRPTLEDPQVQEGADGTDEVAEVPQQSIDAAIEAMLQNVTEDDIIAAEREQTRDRELLHARAAILAAKGAGMFNLEDESEGASGTRADEDVMSQLGAWHSTLEGAIRQEASLEQEAFGGITATGSDHTGMWHAPQLDVAAGVERRQPATISASTTQLNEEQKRAHDIIEDHLINTMNGMNATFRLAWYKAKGEQAKHYLSRQQLQAYLPFPLGGTTVHSLGNIPITFSNTSDDWVSRGGAKARRARIARLGVKSYLIIDEILAKCAADNGDSSLPFDFHQFPPVGNDSGALYCSRPSTDKSPGLMGRELFLKFNTIVFLRQQVRSSDERWNALLSRLRVGLCNNEDLDILHGLVLTDPRCELPDFDHGPWSEAILVTPRHAVRAEWNELALRKLARAIKKPVYIVHAEDIDAATGFEASNAIKLAMASKVDQSEKTRQPLRRRIELVEGMQAMVLLNIATDADVANGTRGVIEKVLLDPREPPIVMDHDGSCRLHYLPVAVLLRPLIPCYIQFPGVPEGLIPLLPRPMQLTGKLASGRTYRVKRRQYPITPGYAFTDYKSQAQTIPKVIVDIAKPPSGKISPFNVYVALSRSRGRDHIRLLRDFDESLFTQHPSDDLREEMHRLWDLERATTRRWEQHFGKATVECVLLGSGASRPHLVPVVATQSQNAKAKEYDLATEAYVSAQNISRSPVANLDVGRSRIDAVDGIHRWVMVGAATQVSLLSPGIGRAMLTSISRLTKALMAWLGP
ncbi:hypothetical protein BKA70DRAFT_1372848 [Coprinopsis sp. MPI-PUGE-AT-0042]|nr:hypothetical protein BKA70DRAFT_1372848 [Coprinopsis sp. MPI-PUGE-AT-0042]